MSLMITNPNRLEKGSLPKSQFDQQGGTIGSDDTNRWKLCNHAETIHDVHCEILMINQQFCLADRSGKTFVNSAHQPLGKNAVIVLKTGDHLRVADYEIRVEFSGDYFSADSVSSIKDLFDVDENKLLDSSRPKASLLSNKVDNSSDFLLTTANSVILDPLLTFASLTSNEEDMGQLIPIQDLGLSERNMVTADNSGTNIEAISFSKQYYVMDEEE